MIARLKELRTGKDGAYEKPLFELADQRACGAVEGEIKRLIPILKKDVGGRELYSRSER